VRALSRRLVQKPGSRAGKVSRATEDTLGVAQGLGQSGRSR
jgi:hypothetical protein